MIFNLWKKLSRRQLNKTIFLLTWSMAFFAMSQVSARAQTVVYVNRNAPVTSANNGTSWTNAYRELRDALNAPTPVATAATPVEIWVAKGTYKPTAGTDRSAAFVVRSHYHVLGGFSGNEILPDHRLVSNAVVLSGDINTPQAQAVTDANFNFNSVLWDYDDPGAMDNSYNVVVCTNATDVILDQLVITAGYASPDATDTNLTDLEIQGMIQPALTSPDTISDTDTNKGQANTPLDRRVVGGGLFYQNSYNRDLTQPNIIVNNCVFTKNYAKGYGGGMGGTEAYIIFSGTTFLDNSSLEEGGGFWGLNQHSDLLSCQFTGNSTLGSGGGFSTRSLPSDRTTPAAVDPDIDLARRQVQTTVGYGIVSLKQTFKLAEGTSVISKLLRAFPKSETAASLLSASTANVEVPNVPNSGIWDKFSAGEFKGAYSAFQAADKIELAATAIEGAYDAISIGVALGDLGYELAQQFGANTNTAAARGWTTFSNGFNTYATPQGLSVLAAFAIAKALGAGPSLDLQANRMRAMQLQMYNQAPSASLRQCAFASNTAGEGGGLYCSYDNLRLEGCSFDNNAAESAGAACFNSWTMPIITSCSFNFNFASAGTSAVQHENHSYAAMINCTFVNNNAFPSNSFCVSVETGSQAKIYNSILWGNVNGDPANADGGADLFVPTKSDLSTNPTNNVLAAYNASGASYGDWIGICEVASSCIQSLKRLPIGQDDYLFFTEDRSYTSAEITEIQTNFINGDMNGNLELYSFYNTGQGIRPTVTTRNNIDSDPMMDGIVPDYTSPVKNAGANSRFSNGIYNSITGVDVQGNPRFYGASIDMGAVELQAQPPTNLTQIYVKPVAAGDGSGSSWANATANLSGALLIPLAKVWVAAGTYVPTSTGDRKASFKLGHDVQMYGGFSGTETNLNQRNLTNNITILSGNIGNPSLATDNSFHVLVFTNDSNGQTIDGFTITGGRGDIGAGILVSNSAPDIRNCIFTDNQASIFGGAIASIVSVGGGMENCQFHSNSAPVGGALYVEPSDITGIQVQSCLFEGNTGLKGGAMTVIGSSVFVMNSLFYSNSITTTVGGYGGALYCSNATLNLANDTFTANTISANDSRVVGGAAVEFSGNFQFAANNCIFWLNTVVNPGAAAATMESQQLHIVGASSTDISYDLIQGLATYNTPGYQNFSRDPLFVDPAHANYQLRNYSPAVDAGQTISYSGGIDLAGNPRVVNLATDLGAYEYQLSPLQLSMRIKLQWTCDGTGNIYTLALVTNNPAVTNFTWQVDEHDGNGFVNVPASAPFSGTTNATLMITAPTLSMIGWTYQLTSGDFVSDAVTPRLSGPVVYVNANASGANNGTNWANAFTSLQAALDTAEPCAEVWVAAGTYFPTNDPTAREAAFSLSGGVSVYGGFNGTETAQSQRNSLTNSTILSGRILSAASDDTLDSQNIFVNLGGNPEAPVDPGFIDGFTFVGATDGSMLNNHASPLIQNCIFIDDQHSVGGIVNQGNSTPTVVNCTFVQVPYTVCGVGSGATLSITSSNNPAWMYQWQLDNGGGFTPITGDSNYNITTNATGSVLNITTVPAGTQYRFVIVGTGYTSPPLRMLLAQPTIVYVNANVVGGNNDGTTWSDAYSDLGVAMQNVSSCVEMWVARGTYLPGSNPSLQVTFAMKPGLTMYGGFIGTETTRDQRNWTTNLTILHPTPGSSVIDNRDAGPVDASAVLDGFVFNQCSGYDVIDNYGDSPTIRNCLFTGLTGFAINNRNSQPAIVNCTFSNNLTTAIYNDSSSPTITGCSFIGQTTTEPGGGIHNLDQSSPLITACTFRGNTAGWGGGIANSSSSSTILRCVFQNNSSGNGGAIWDQGTSVTTVHNSLFINNGAPQFRGGAIAEYGSLLDLENCTLANNFATYSAGGLLMQGQTGVVQNCVFWNNTATVPDYTNAEASQIDLKSGQLLLTNNVIQFLATLPGVNNTSHDPLFVDLVDNNYSLSQFSPAINAGTNLDLDTLDLAGNPRLVGANVDPGAYEYQATPTNAAVLLNSSPLSQLVCAGNLARFTVTGDSGTNYTYVWQMSTDGTNYVNVPAGGTYTVLNVSSNNSSSLIISNTVLAQNNYRFRVAIGDFNSGPAVLSVNAPEIIYVSATATGANNGLDWADAYTNVFTAIAAADACSQVWVARGNYVATNAAGSLSASLEQNVKLYGGFAGNETNLVQRNWVTNVTQLTGSADLPLFYNIGYTTPIDNSAVLDGFTLTAGSGGAIRNYTASPVIRNCIIQQVAGVAVQNSASSSPLFDSCIFRGNTNGALVNQNCSVTITNCLFTNNTTALLPGAAIENVGAAMFLIDSSFINNRVAGEVGGAIDSRSTTNWIVRTTFLGNSGSQGGAISFINCSGEIRDSLFANNTASQSGGAITMDQSPLTIRNATITQNTSPTGGGGGIFLLTGTAMVVNSILWHNRDRLGDAFIERAQLYPYYGTFSVSNSVIEKLSANAGFGNVGFDPLFNNAGNNDFTLTAPSPAVNTGNSAATGGEAWDLNRAPRIVGAAVDIGAYEFSNAPATTINLLSVPVSQTVCQGGNAIFAVTGYTNSGADFNWQEIVAGNPVALTSGNPYAIVTGGNTSSLIVSNVTDRFDGKQFQFTVSSLNYTSAVFTLSATIPDLIYVNASATGGNSGESWTNAYTSLQQAIANASACTVVWVAAGTYTPSGSGSFSLKPGLKIYGGFAGTETNLAQRDWTNHVSLLLGNGANNVVYNSGYYAPLDGSSALDGFTVTSPNQNYAVYNSEGANVTYLNCTFANSGGIAMLNSYSSPLIANCVFTNNANTAVYNSINCAPVITNCVFTANHSLQDGGAIYDGNSTPIIAQSQFFNNTAPGNGGAIADASSSSTIFNCIFGNNTANYGGAVSSFASSNSLVNCLFYRNNSTFKGGAVSSASDTLKFVNCTFAENSARSATYGGIYGVGGGIYQQGGSVQFLNSILWLNSDGNAGTVLNAQAYLESGGGSETFSNCCLQGFAGNAGNNFSLDPLFADSSIGDFSLTPQSPMIDAGNSNFVTGVTLDLANRSRVQLANVDVGAYESTNASTTIQLQSSPSLQTVCEGDVAAFTMTLNTNYGVANFAWYYNTGSGWTLFSGFSGTITGPALGSYTITSTLTNTILLVSDTSAAMTNYQFRVSSGILAYTTPAAGLVVTPPTAIYVNRTASPGGDGTSWATAFTDIQTALNSINSCRRMVWVAAGTYYPTNSGLTFNVRDGQQLYGGFAGTETNLAQRNILANPTVLSGNLISQGNTNNAGAVVTFDAGVNPVGPSTVVDGFTITGGSSEGVIFFRANATVQNCLIESNLQYGVYMTASTGLVQNCSVRLNGTDPVAYNGGVIIYDGFPVIANSTISGNLGNGGGIETLTSANGIVSQVTIENCLVTGNAGGGGVSAGANLSIVNCTISGNSGYSTGGVEDNSGVTTITNSIIWNNLITYANNSVEQAQVQNFNNSATVNVSHSCVQGLSVYGGNGNTGADPLFNFGIDPQTAPVVAGDFHLQPCSPLINAGVNVGGLSTNDLDGLPRIVNGTVDLGAYELQASAETSLSITAQPVSFTNCATSQNSFSVTASGDGLTYQWQVDYNDGIGFVPVTDGGIYQGSATSTLLLTGATQDANGDQFRCVVTSAAGCSVISTTATLTVHASRWFVNVNAAPGGDGLSWATAFNDIRTALRNPLLDECGSEIWVAAGTYNIGSGDPSTAETFTQGVSVYGGFTGTETELTQRDWNAHPTILNGIGGGMFRTGGAAVGTGDLLPVDAARLDGFVIINNQIAIVLEDFANPTIANCVFHDNGVAISAGASAPHIVDCIFTNNGTGLQLSSQTFWYISPDPIPPTEVDHCLFQAQTGSGIANDGNYASVEARNSIFSGNTISGSGGAISMYQGDVTLWNCTITGNSSSSLGTVFCCTLNAYNTLFWNNSSADHVGSIDAECGSHLYNCSVDTVDPDFVQPVDPATAPTTAGDLHLNICSPVINGGNNSFTSAGDTDFDGAPRIADGTVDLGAYEFQGVILRFTSQPVDQTGSDSTPVSFAATVNKTNVLFQWQVKRGGGNFVNVTNDATHFGATTGTLTLTNQIPAMNGEQYVCLVTSAEGCVITSSTAVYHHIDFTTSGASTAGGGILPADGSLNLNFNQGLAAGSVSDSTIVVQAMQKGHLRTSLGDFASLTATNSSVTIQPSVNYAAGEMVWVTATRNLQTASNLGAKPFVWGFRAATSTNSPGNFYTGPVPQTLGADTNNDLAIGDVNRDDALDVLTVNAGANRLWMNDGHGGFTDSGQILGSNGVAAVFGDVNGDGYLDAIIVNASGTCEVWLNNGTGVFARTQSFLTNARTVVLGDLNGDGALDLFIGCSGPSQVWLNNGAGGFADSGQQLGNAETASVALGDLNGDGALDAFVVNRLGQPATVWTNNGNGFFGDTGQRLPHGDGRKVELGDLNGDGFLDAAVASTDLNQVWTNDGAGNFSSMFWTDATQPGDSIIADDFSAHPAYPPSHLLDGDLSDSGAFYALASPSQTTYTLDIKPSAVLSPLTGLGFYEYLNSADNPTGFDLSGSTNGTDFNLITSNAWPALTGYHPTPVWTYVSFTNTAAYSTYRIAFHIPPGSSQQYMGFTEMQMLYFAPKLGTGGNRLSLADVNGDGQLDLVITYTNGTSKVWLNNGVNGFTPAPVDHANDAGGAIAIGDLNGDGAVDFVQGRGLSGAGNIVSFNLAVDASGDENTVIALASDSFATKFTNSGGSGLAKIEIISLPANGALELNGSPVSLNQEIAVSDLSNLTYVPNPDYFGSDAFSWQGSDGTAYMPTVFQTYIVVNDVQHAPVAVDDYITVSQSGTVTTLADGTASVLANDYDLDGDTLTASLIQGPAFGSLDFRPDGAFVYVQDGSGPQDDSFVYQISDGHGHTAQATANIHVTPINHPPTDIYLHPINGIPFGFQDGWNGIYAAEIEVMDQDAGDTFTAALVSGAGDQDNNKFTVDTGTYPEIYTLGGHINYLGQTNYTIRLRVTDSGGATYEQSLVIPIYTTPVALPQTVPVARDNPQDITLTYSNLDGTAVSDYTIVNYPANGTLSGSGPDFTYTPNANFLGQDSFTFTVTANGITSATAATVSLNVTGQDNPPVANNQSLAVPENSSTNLVLSGSDINGQALTFAIMTPPANGTLSALTNGMVTYLPATNFIGNDNFTFVANDGFSNSAPATVTLNVTKVEIAPVALDESMTLTQYVSGPVISGPAYLQAYAPNTSYYALNWTILTQPQHGTLLNSGDLPYVSYLPNAGWFGTDSFTYTVNDGQLSSVNPATYTIINVRQNTAPTTSGQVITVPANTPVGLTLNGYDQDRDPIHFAIINPPTHGSLSGTPPNLTYTPDNNFFGIDAFNYQVYDDYGGTNTGRIVFNPPFTKVVTVTNDSGVGSLGLAFLQIDQPSTAPGAWTILFDPQLAGKTVTLSLYYANPGGSVTASPDTALNMNDFYNGVTLAIDGADAPGVILSADTNGPPMRLFHLYYAGLTLRNLILCNGRTRGEDGSAGPGSGGGGGAGLGGLIYSEGGNLNISNVVFANSLAIGGNGGDQDLASANNPDGGDNDRGYGSSSAAGTGGNAYGYFGGGGGAGLDAGAGSPGVAGYGAGAGGGIPGSSYAGGGAGSYGGGGGGGSMGGGGGGFGAGGAIYNHDGYIYLEDCVFTNNQAVGGLGGAGADISLNGQNGRGLGGAIYNYGGQFYSSGVIYLHRCRFLGNGADAGAAVFNYADQMPTLLDLETVTLADLTTNDIGTDSSASTAYVVPPLNLTLKVVKGGTNSLPIVLPTGAVSGLNQPITSQFISGTLPGNDGTTTFTTSSVIYVQDGTTNLNDAFAVLFTGPHGDISTDWVSVVVRSAPVVQSMTVYRLPGSTLKISLADVATNWSDEDGDAMHLANVNVRSWFGVQLSTNSNFILYAVGPNANGDMIQYGIVDTDGETATGTIYINLVSGTTGAINGNISIANGQALLKFAGRPGTTYSVQRSTDLFTWKTIWTTNTPDNGLFRFTDTFSDLGGIPPISAYYRLSWAP